MECFIWIKFCLFLQIWSNTVKYWSTYCQVPLNAFPNNVKYVQIQVQTQWNIVLLWRHEDLVVSMREDWYTRKRGIVRLSRQVSMICRLDLTKEKGPEISSNAKYHEIVSLEMKARSTFDTEQLQEVTSWGSAALFGILFWAALLPLEGGSGTRSWDLANTILQQFFYAINSCFCIFFELQESCLVSCVSSMPCGTMAATMSAAMPGMMPGLQC